MKYSQELILSRGLVKVSCLLIDEEGVRHPDELDVLSPHHQLLQPGPLGEREPRVSPKLAEVHVKREVLDGSGKNLALSRHFLPLLFVFDNTECSRYKDTHDEAASRRWLVHSLLDCVLSMQTVND